MTDIEKLVEDCARIFCCGNTCASLHDSRPCCAADHHVRTCAVIRHTLEFAAREGVPNQSKGGDANAGAAAAARMQPTPSPAGEDVEPVRKELIALTACRRCDCADCTGGYENHSHWCASGPNCVETPERWAAWRLKVSVVANKAAETIHSLSSRVEVAERAKALVKELAALTVPEDADDRPCDDTWEDANTLWGFIQQAKAIVGGSDENSN